MSDYIATLANALAWAVDANDVQLVLTHSTPEQRTFVASVAALLLEFLAPKEAALQDRSMFLSEVLSEADRLGHRRLKVALEGLWALDIGHGAWGIDDRCPGRGGGPSPSTLRGITCPRLRLG